MEKNQKKNKQLLVDISELVNRDVKTGIQRVVRSVLMQLLKSPPAGYFVRPVYSKTGKRLYYADNFVSKFIDRPHEGKDGVVKLENGDIFLGLDLSLELFPYINPTLQKMRRIGVRVNYIVYDLIPLLHPWHGQRLETLFKAWLEAASQYADGLICISKAVSEDVNRWLKDNPYARETPIHVSYFHLGADIVNSVPTSGMPSNARDFLNRLSVTPTFLTVGTLEPRKGHAQTIEAFELLWKAGEQVNLVIVGKLGWNVDSLIAKIKTHAELGKQLFWLNGISDEFLENIYKTSDALLAVSEAEGFGLPLIEAAQHKLPIIARDIPVFREVAGKYAYYFKGLDAGSLAEAISVWLDLNKKNQAPQSVGMPWLTWEQSTNQLLSKLN